MRTRARERALVPFPVLTSGPSPYLLHQCNMPLRYNEDGYCLYVRCATSLFLFSCFSLPRPPPVLVWWSCSCLVVQFYQSPCILTLSPPLSTPPVLASSPTGSVTLSEREQAIKYMHRTQFSSSGEPSVLRRVTRR